MLPDLLLRRRRHDRALARLVRRRVARALPDDRRDRRLGRPPGRAPSEGARWERAAQREHRDARLPGRQRVDRAVDRRAARLHVPRRDRADARGLRAGARAVGPRGLVASDRAGRARPGARAPRRPRARPPGTRARRRAHSGGRRPDEGSVAFAELALRAMEAGAWEEAGDHAAQGVALIEEAQPGRLPGVRARDGRRGARRRPQGDLPQARGYVTKVHRIRPLLQHGLPWLSVQTGLELARVHLALGEPSAAGAVLSEAEAILRVRPRLGTLIEQARELRQRVAARRLPVANGPSPSPQPSSGCYRS